MYSLNKKTSRASSFMADRKYVVFPICFVPSDPQALQNNSQDGIPYEQQDFKLAIAFATTKMVDTKQGLSHLPQSFPVLFGLIHWIIVTHS